MLDAQFQTIVYDSKTGKIVEILSNQYIKSRRSLNLFMGDILPSSIKFFYFHTSVRLDKSFYRIVMDPIKNKPNLVSKSGDDPLLLIMQQEGAAKLSKYKSILYKFEGGMGDYCDQADVVIMARTLNPEKRFIVSLPHKNRAHALELMSGWKDIKVIGDDISTVRGSAVIDFNKINYIPEYAPVGKVGIYSVVSGLPSAAGRNNFSLPDRLIQSGKKLLEMAAPFPAKHKICIHTISGNTNTKSLAPEDFLKIFRPFLDRKDTVFYHLGGAGEVVIRHPHVVSFQGKLNWQDVVSALYSSSACVCIDSAVLHLVQHMPVPALSLWGPTDPVNILGTKSGIISFTSTADCVGCNRWECDSMVCMKMFDVLEVRKTLNLFLGD